MLTMGHLFCSIIEVLLQYYVLLFCVSKFSPIFSILEDTANLLSHPPSGRSQSSSLRPRSDSGLALWRAEEDDWLLVVLALRHSWKLYGDD